ncbi:MAG: ABC transporter ATP-binding protein [Bacteroidales bacterium]|nr:ABC transporter ATP-binding protein [Bacteroidales bacterium]
MFESHHPDKSEPEMIIEARDIVKSFGTLQVLKGISLSVAKGEIVSITGASGAGKTTLLEILGTLSTPDGGSLVLDGKDVLSLRGERLSAFRCLKVGFVFQAHRLLPEFTALENVMIPALIAGKGRAEAEKKAAALLETVGLGARISHKPAALSGGEQQRVAVARALVNSPAVLFADEPTGNLDSATKEEIHKLFFSLRESTGQTMVIVTHDDGLAQMCDRCLRMKDGEII